MDLGPHATFIIAAYAASALILALLIGWIVGEYRSLTRTLADFDQRGIARRSDERPLPTLPRSRGRVGRGESAA